MMRMSDVRLSVELFWLLVESLLHIHTEASELWMLLALGINGNQIEAAFA